MEEMSAEFPAKDICQPQSRAKPVSNGPEGFGEGSEKGKQMFAGFVKGYWKDESGAVTVDWVVLTAAITGLALVVLYPISQGTESLANGTASYIDNIDSGYSTD